MCFVNLQHVMLCKVVFLLKKVKRLCHHLPMLFYVRCFSLTPPAQNFGSTQPATIFLHTPLNTIRLAFATVKCIAQHYPIRSRATLYSASQVSEVYPVLLKFGKPVRALYTIQRLDMACLAIWCCCFFAILRFRVLLKHP